ncbi:MAG: tyrosine-type recombinase/integrase, partial [Candidatus Marinimicrobia bacterium]|nr:tyrosine-type recombinase/integrase [Candidatus Neomarinimicrobiota bacterium]
KLRRMCEEAAIIAKSKGNQMAVRNRLIIEMALGTGLRVSELANLKIDDIHIRKGQNSLIVNNGKGDRKPQSGRWYRARHLADLPSTKQTAMEALERTQAQLGQEKVESAVMPMVVENSNAARLLYRLFQPLSGASIQQKNSFLDGKKEQQIASKALTITDNPIIVRGLGSRLYDGDGIAAKEMPVIQDGVLKNYYIDVYYGRKLGWAPTTGYASNIIIQPGKRSAKTIEKNLDRGILVTNWLGGNANGTTGDFSLGVAGWLIENGQRTQPIGEMNISGNYSDLLMNLKEVGNDPYPYSSFRTPTLLFNDVSFSGT